MKLPLKIAILCTKESQIKENILGFYESCSIFSLQTEDLSEFQEHIKSNDPNIIAVCETAINRKSYPLVNILEGLAKENPNSIIYFYSLQSGEEQDIELDNVINFYPFNFSLKKLNYETFLQHIKNYFGITKKEIGIYQVKNSKYPDPYKKLNSQSTSKEVEQEAELQNRGQHDREEKIEKNQNSDDNVADDKSVDEDKIEEVKINPVKPKSTYKEDGKKYFADLSSNEQEKLKYYALEKTKEMASKLQFKTLKSIHANTRNIAVISATPRAGTSFLVNNLAVALGQHNISCGVLEAPQLKPYLYYVLQKQIPTTWQCGFAYAHQHSKIVMENFIYYKGVYWMPFHPSTFERETFSIQYLPSLIYFLTAATLPILFIDISSGINSGFTEDIVLPHIDEIWFVIQDDLYTLPYELEIVNRIIKKTKDIKHEFILNQYTEYTSHKKIRNLLQKEPLVKIPYHPIVKKTLAKDVICYLTKEGKEWLTPVFKPFYSRLIRQYDENYLSSIKHLFKVERR